MSARKLCKTCGFRRLESQFTGPRGRVCKPCQKRNRTAQVRKLHLGRTYGLTQEEYDRILEYQEGACAGCGGTRRYNLHVDHDHRAGLVRGLLCASCNKVLGVVRDSGDTLDQLGRYLRLPPALVLDINVVAPEQPESRKRRYRR